MLVISRRKGERIRVGNDIVLTYLGEHRGQIRLGWDAPKDVRILRDELDDREKEKNGDSSVA